MNGLHIEDGELYQLGSERWFAHGKPTRKKRQTQPAKQNKCSSCILFVICEEASNCPSKHKKHPKTKNSNPAFQR